jgi:hypothetical protein
MKKITYLMFLIIIIFVISVLIKNKKIYKGVKKNYKGVGIASTISKRPYGKFQQIRNEKALENMFKSLVNEGGRCESIFPDSDIIVEDIRLNYKRKGTNDIARSRIVYSYDDRTRPRPIPLLDGNDNIIPLKDAYISFYVSSSKVKQGRRTFFQKHYNSGPVIQMSTTKDGCVQVILLLAIENNKYYFCKLVLKEF